MSGTKKASNNVAGNVKPITTSSLKSHKNDPFFVKKVEEAKTALKKLVLPDGKGK